ncbi:Regulator of MON1-CCZ1 complex [Linum perenne]
MSASSSSSQLNVGLSGSGGLSHVYSQYPPLRWSVPGSRGLYYDDANKLLLSPTSDQIFSWKTVPFSPEAAATTDSISEGPILSIRYSLDAKSIAVQRSNQEIQFIHRETQETFTHTCRADSESILGFFWTDCPLCDLVLVKTRCQNFFLWLLGIVRLPRFEMVMAKSDASSKPILAAEDVFIVTVYGRIYCLQIDRIAMQLHLYRFYRDAVVQQTKQLCLAITRTIILERKPVPMVSKAMDILVSSYSHSLKTNVNLKASKAGETSASAGPNASNSSITANKNSQGAESSRSEVQSSSSHNQQLGPNNDQLNADNSEKQDSQLTSPAISPDEMYTCVFAPVEETMDGDPSYLVSIIVEFLRSTNSEKIKVHPNIYILTIQLLAHNGRFAELSLFIINKVLEPSKEVAMQLLESGRQNSQIKKLALDMLRQLFSHHDYVVLLVRDGCYLEALRYARKNQVTTVPPSLFLEAALASKDSQHLAAVLRFFSDFIPGFRNTSEHKMYFRILNEMSTAVAV